MVTAGEEQLTSGKRRETKESQPSLPLLKTVVPAPRESDALYLQMVSSIPEYLLVILCIDSSFSRVVRPSQIFPKI